MRQKTEYRSAKRSRRLIRNAFVALMAEKPLAKITVTDVVKRADINRGTFYAHYADTQAVIETIEHEIIAELMSILNDFDFRTFFDNPAPLFDQINQYLNRDLAFYRTLINSSGATDFLAQLKQTFVDYLLADAGTPQQLRQSREYEVLLHFFAGGIVNLYQLWFRGALDFSLSDVTAELTKLVRTSAPLFHHTQSE